MKQPVCALVLSTFRPVTGGYQRQLEAVFAQLVADYGWEVDVVTRAQPNALASEVVAGLPVRRVGRDSGQFVAGALARLLRRRPSVVVTAQLGSAAAAAASYCRVTGRPLVVRLAGSEDPRNAAARFVRVAARRVVLVAPARHQLDTIDWGVPRMVMPNGVRVADGRGEAAVLWYGRDTVAKNPAGFSALVGSTGDVNYIAIGDASLPSRANLRQDGWVADAAEALAQVSVFVSTSLSEGSPNVALQALAMGRPVVAFDNAAYRELAATYPEHVRIVPFGDVASLAAAVRDALAGGPLAGAAVTTVAQAAARWDYLLRGIA